MLDKIRQRISTICAILKMLPSPQVWRGGVRMESFLSFIIAVMAGVVCPCINKWLDGDE